MFIFSAKVVVLTNFPIGVLQELKKRVEKKPPKYKQFHNNLIFNLLQISLNDRREKHF